MRWRARSVTTVIAFALCYVPGAARAQENKTVALEDLVKEAAQHSPEILRARHAARAAGEVSSRVGSLPDPMISASLQNVPFNDIALDASPMTGILVGITQVVPFPGKLGRREELARASATTTQREADLARAAVTLQVRQAYWELSFAERANEITADSERILNSLADAVHARLSVAEAAQQDALQAEVAHSRIRAMLERRRQAVISARRALNRAVGRAPDAALGQTIAPPRSVVPFDVKRLNRAVQQSNPAVVVTRARVESAERAVDEAERDRLPDLQFGAGYRFRAAAPGDMTHGADMFVITFGMTLPVWLGAKQNARVRENEERQAEAEAQLRAVELDSLTGLQQQLDAIERLETEVQLHEREILPEADSALDASITDYQFARVGFESVLHNWQTLLDSKLELLRLLTERAGRLAAVDFLSGAHSGDPP